MLDLNLDCLLFEFRAARDSIRSVVKQAPTMARLHRPHWEFDHQRRSRGPVDFQRYLLSENALNTRQPQKTWQVTKAAARKKHLIGKETTVGGWEKEIPSLEDTILMSELVTGGSLFPRDLGLIFDIDEVLFQYHLTPTLHPYRLPWYYFSFTNQLLLPPRYYTSWVISLC